MIITEKTSLPEVLSYCPYRDETSVNLKPIMTKSCQKLNTKLEKGTEKEADKISNSITESATATAVLKCRPVRYSCLSRHR